MNENHHIKYDVFISYSRKDIEFVRRLQRALGSYTPAKDLQVPQRRLRVFRDESDFQGSEYQTAVEQNLKQSSKLLLICSPNSSASTFVGDEIRKFAEFRGPANIVSILLSGVPNNQPSAVDAEKAFHSELISKLPIPLAADYRGCGPRDRVDRERFESSWFKVLADIYADYGVDRNAIEQREKIRQRRTRRVRTAIVSSVTLALASLTVWALISRQEAILQRNTAQSRFLATQSLSGAQTLEMTLLLAAAAYKMSPTAEAWEALFAGLQRQPSIERFLHGHDGVPTALKVSDDGSCAAGSSNQRIVVWELKTGVQRAVIQTPGSKPVAHSFVSECDGVVAGFEDGHIESWRVDAKPTLLWSTSAASKTVTAIAVNAIDRKVAVGFLGGRIALHSLDSGELLAEAAESDVNRWRITALRFDMREKQLASVDWNGTLQRWTPSLEPAGKPAVCLGSGGNALYALTADLSRCASGNDPQQPVTVTNFNQPDKPEAVIDVEWLLALDFTRDGRHLATATQGGEIRLWNLAAARSGNIPSSASTVFAEHRGDVTALAHNPVDDTFISGARDQSIVVWRPLLKHRLVTESATGISNFRVATFDDALQKLLVATTSGELFRLDFAEPSKVESVGSFGIPVTALTVHERNGEIFGGTPEGDVIVLELSGRQRRLATGRKEPIERLRLDPQTSRLAAVGEDGTVFLWNLDSGGLITTFPEKNAGSKMGGLTSSVDVAFEPGGNRVASIHGRDQAFLWQWQGSAFRFDPFPMKPTSYFTSVAFSPDLRTVALGTGIYEGGIALFDALSTKPAGDIPSEHDQLDVTGLAFSPDGRLLISSGFDQRINVWDVTSRRRLGTAYSAAGPVTSVTFDKTGTTAGAVTQQGTVVRWNFNPANWLIIACRVVNRNLRPDEGLRLFGTPDGLPSCSPNT